MRIPLRLSLIVLCLISIPTFAQETQIVDSPATVAPEVFPIFPWDILPAKKEAYADAKSCGFNLAGFVHPENLDLVASAGLKCFVASPLIKIRGNEKVSDEEIAQAVAALTKQTSHHPAVFGYHLIDEPAAALVPAVVRWTKAFQVADPGHVAYTNLFPINEKADGKGPFETQYEHYLAALLDGHPGAFSFDHYAMMDDGSVRPTWFDNLEVARKLSIQYNIPLWHVCLANSHFHYAQPSAATFNFQIFTSLAYGVRGIGWFTFTARDRGNYRNSAIDITGRHSPTYALLRDANETLHRLAPIMTMLRSVNVFHHPDVPAGCQGIDTSHFLASLSGSGPFCVGEFLDAQKRPAILIVNRSLTRSTTISFTLKTQSPVQRVSSLTGRIRPWGAEDNWLPPGGGILLLLHE